MEGLGREFLSRRHKAIGIFARVYAATYHCGGQYNILRGACAKDIGRLGGGNALNVPLLPKGSEGHQP